MKNNFLIYDFETLSLNRQKCVVLSIAFIEYSEDVFVSDSPYVYGDLVKSASFFKFDVAQQIKEYDRLISKKTLEWWKSQGEGAKKNILPSSEDISLSEFPDIFSKFTNGKKKIFTRGNTFDPIVVDGIFEQFGLDNPNPYYKTMDTRSYLEGLTWGNNIPNNFKIKEIDDVFVPHDPRHDIAYDIMRMQLVIRNLNG